MEILILPLVGLGGLYFISREQARKKQGNGNGKSNNNGKQIIATEGFSNVPSLPNTNVPDKNYVYGTTPVNPVNDITSKLSTVNAYQGGSAYTDKYFSTSSNYPIEYGQSPSTLNASYKSLTGETVPMNYFQHNNMQPFFGSKSHESGPHNGTESYLDSHTGSGSTYITKREQAPLFQPKDNTQHPNGFPNVSDFVQSRMNPSLRHANVQPFAKQQVQPGGQDLLMARDELYREKTVDELRVKQKAKVTGFTYGYEGPAKSRVTNRGIMGIQEKNRPETSFEMGQDRWMTTTGQEKGATLRSIEVLHNVHRPDTTREYHGNAKYNISQEYIPGEYDETHRQAEELSPEQFGPAYIPHQQSAYENDYGVGSHSNSVVPNNRITSTNYGQSYFGAIGGVLGSVLAPLMDTFSLRPTRKQNTIGNMRPYQNAKSTVEGTYIYDPNERPEPTMRELMGESKYHWNVNGVANGDGYLTTPHQMAHTYRAETDERTSYMGGASATGAKQIRPYDEAYSYESNGVRASTLESAGRLQQGNIRLFNNHVNMHTSSKQEEMYLNRRPADGMRYVEPPSADTMGINPSLQHNQNTALYAGMQLDRNNGDVLHQLQDNPYSHNILRTL